MSAAANSATPTISLTRRETCDPDPLTASNLHDNGEHERPATRSFAEETAELDAQPLLDQALIGAFLDARLFHGVAQQFYAIGQQLLAIFHNETARNDFRNAFKDARLLVDRDDRHHESVFGQMPPI